MASDFSTAPRSRLHIFSPEVPFLIRNGIILGLYFRYLWDLVRELDPSSIDEDTRVSMFPRATFAQSSPCLFVVIMACKE